MSWTADTASMAAGMEAGLAADLAPADAFAPAAMQALAASLITEERVILPVRHHSPACALQVLRLLEQLRPSRILIEGPRGFTPLIGALLHPQAKMPLALYAHAVLKPPRASIRRGLGADAVERVDPSAEPADDADALPDNLPNKLLNKPVEVQPTTELIRSAAYYPFCESSPELVALRWAQEHACPADFIDLDFAEQQQVSLSWQAWLQQRAEQAELAGDASPQPSVHPDPNRIPNPNTTPSPDAQNHRSLLDESYWQHSATLQHLADQLGCRDHEELWEHLFEVPAAGVAPQTWMTQLAAYCWLARQDAEQQRSADPLANEQGGGRTTQSGEPMASQTHNPTQNQPHAPTRAPFSLPVAHPLALDATLAREAEMAWHIQQAVQQRAELLRLRRDDGDPPPGPVLAVMGGFHAVVMPQWLALQPDAQTRRAGRPDSAAQAKSRALRSDGLTPSIDEQMCALIRYSQQRLDRLNGYSAGMTSPAWHQAQWAALEQGLRLGQRKKTATSTPTEHPHADQAATLMLRRRRDTALELLHQLADQLRHKGLPIPTPTLVAASQQMLHLAMLRQRAAPTRDDLIDAVTSCFIQGQTDADGQLVLHQVQSWLCGDAVGQVPPGTERPPLVRDVEYRARRQRLRIDDSEPRRCVLDLYRRPEHRLTSRLLHGLNLLGAPLGVRQSGPDFIHGLNLDRLQEHWDYQYHPGIEGALIEAALYGNTLPQAVATRFAELLDEFEAGLGDDDQPPPAAKPSHKAAATGARRAPWLPGLSALQGRHAGQGAQRDAQGAAALLTEACVLGLQDHLPRVLSTLRTTLAADADLASVAQALVTLGLLWESREPLQARELQALPTLIRSAYERAVYLGMIAVHLPGESTTAGTPHSAGRPSLGAGVNALPSATSGDDGQAGSHDETAAQAVIGALVRLRELLVSSAGVGLDASIYHDLIERYRRAHPVPLVRGAACGLAFLLGAPPRPADPADATHTPSPTGVQHSLGQAITGHLSGLTDPRQAVSFVRGLLQTAREVAWQHVEVLDALDRHLRHWDEPSFVQVLPELRLAFAEMTPLETDRIAAAVLGHCADRIDAGGPGSQSLSGQPGADLDRLLGPIRYDLAADDIQRHLQLSIQLRECLLRDGLGGWLHEQRSR